MEKADRNEAKKAFKRDRRRTETPKERVERRRLKALRKEAKKLETPEQRAERRRRKKEAKKIAKREAKKAGIPYIPAAYTLRPQYAVSIRVSLLWKYELKLDLIRRKLTDETTMRRSLL
jgi:hypothetical protein